MKHKPTAVIFDIDGTITDTAHRMHLITGKKKDWPTFFRLAQNDPVNTWCANIIQGLRATTNHRIILVSGRSENDRDMTRKWLAQHAIKVDAIYLRPEHRKFDNSATVKNELYNLYIKENYYVLMVIDDRTQDVKMWRSLGLTCLQCKDGDGNE